MHTFIVINIWHYAFKIIRKMRKLGRKYGNTIVCIVNYDSLFHSDKIKHSNIGKRIFISTGMGIVS